MPGQPRPHAVSSISGSVINTTFSYDDNGNQNTGNGLTLTYASINKPVTIARGVALITFAHDTEGQRYKQMAPSGEILYLAASGVSVEKFTGAGGLIQWTDYLQAGGETIGMRVKRAHVHESGQRFHESGHRGGVVATRAFEGVVLAIPRGGMHDRRLTVAAF